MVVIQIINCYDIVSFISLSNDVNDPQRDFVYEHLFNPTCVSIAVNFRIIVVVLTGENVI